MEYISSIEAGLYTCIVGYWKEDKYEFYQYKRGRYLDENCTFTLTDEETGVVRRVGYDDLCRIKPLGFIEDKRYTQWIFSLNKYDLVLMDLIDDIHMRAKEEKIIKLARQVRRYVLPDLYAYFSLDYRGSFYDHGVCTVLGYLDRAVFNPKGFTITYDNAMVIYECDPDKIKRFMAKYKVVRG